MVPSGVFSLMMNCPARWKWLFAGPLLAACGGGGEVVTTATTEASDTGSETAASTSDASTSDATTAGATTDDATTDGVECPPGQEDCGQGCVDVAVEPDHCGGCGIACVGSESCVDGACALECPTGAVNCFGTCQYLDYDQWNCGACGHICSDDEICYSGMCRYNCYDVSWCGGNTCADTLQDPDHCGSCSNACDPGDVCASGTCMTPCTESEEDCGGVCVDLSSDPLNCGYCRFSCPDAPIGAFSCVDGDCKISCPDGYVPNDLETKCTSCGPAVILGAKPLSYWRLGEAKGAMVAVDQQAIQDGAYQGVGLEIAGVASDDDTAARFGDTDLARVDIPGYAAMPDAALSVELWVRGVDSPGIDETAFSYAVDGEDDELLIFNLADITLRIGGASAPTGVSVLDGAWHHLVVTWTSAGGNARIYVDGAEVFQLLNFQSGYLVKSGGHIALGHEQDGVNDGYDPTQRLVGELDEVALYDHVLGPDAALAHYNALQGLMCE
ncbi:MAG: LamG-like jellyroll fold domain-containing protein [Nannocystaceae bacterium]|nr:hypothetical protein [Myxococcales bacterium]